MAFFDCLIDKSLRFFINSKQMIKSAPPLLTDEVLICVDLPVGDGASTSRFNWYALNNTGGTQMQPAVDDIHTFVW